MVPLTEPVRHLVETAVEGLLADLASAAPRLLAGVLFLALVATSIKLVMLVVRRLLVRTFPDESTVYRQFIGLSVAGFLWFGAGLTFLSIVGLGAIAVALGTASGFLALGVSYAVSGMIADVVAGVYLLRDPDFEAGDHVTVGDMTGDISAIELRKTRFDVDGDRVVRANAEIEKRWTNRTGGRP